MTVIKAADRTTKIAPADQFGGTVLQDQVFLPQGASRLRATNVTFNPGGRTNWHSHPVGQVLFCTSGVGRLEIEGDKLYELHPGDVAIIPPDTRHWHGAAPDSIFTHLAMSENNDKGEGTNWQDPVSETDYNKKPAGRM